MSTVKPISTYIHQFIYTIKAYPKGIRFIRRNQLWRGLGEYGWFSKLLIAVAVLVGFKFLLVFAKLFGKTSWDGPFAAVNNMGLVLGDFAHETFSLMRSGSMKYIMLILLEVVIFHFARRTIEVLTKKSQPITFDDFFRAQIRMLKVSVRSWVMESIAVVLIKAFFDFFHAGEFLQPVLVYGVQCYFVGFAIVDNFNEQYHLTIKESAKYTQHYAGVAIAVGLALKVLFYIPVAGAVLAPLITSVVCVLVMFELSDLELLGKKTAIELEDLV